MESGTISTNTAHSSSGGIYVDDNGSFTMKGGTISDNTATYYGGVAVVGTFTMSGGEISGNNAQNKSDGDVHMYENGTFIKNGGSIDATW